MTSTPGVRDRCVVVLATALLGLAGDVSFLATPVGRDCPPYC